MSEDTVNEKTFFQRLQDKENLYKEKNNQLKNLENKRHTLNAECLQILEELIPLQIAYFKKAIADKDRRIAELEKSLTPK